MCLTLMERALDSCVKTEISFSWDYVSAARSVNSAPATVSFFRFLIHEKHRKSEIRFSRETQLRIRKLAYRNWTRLIRLKIQFQNFSSFFLIHFFSFSHVRTRRGSPWKCLRKSKDKCFWEPLRNPAANFRYWSRIEFDRLNFMQNNGRKLDFARCWSTIRSPTELRLMNSEYRHFISTGMRPRFQRSCISTKRRKWYFTGRLTCQWAGFRFFHD